MGDSLYLITAPEPTVADEIFLRYDLGQDAWTTLPDPPSTGSFLVAAGDRVLSIAGSDEWGPTADGIFTPEGDSWTVLPEDPLGPSFDRSAAWLGDRLLLTGKRLVDNPGADGPALTRMAELSEDLRTWTVLPDSPIIGGGPIAIGQKVVFPEAGSADGGAVGNWGRFYDYGGIWDSVTRTWSALPAGRPDYPQEGESLPAVGAIGGTSILIGNALLDPGAATWSRIPDPPLSPRYSPAVALGNDALLVWGGTTGAFTDNAGDGSLLRF